MSDLNELVAKATAAVEAATEIKALEEEAGSQALTAHNQRGAMVVSLSLVAQRFRPSTDGPAAARSSTQTRRHGNARSYAAR